VYDVCKTTGQPISKCPHPEKHVFKAIAHVKGTKNQRRTWVIDTRDRKIAERKALEFREEASKKSFKSPKEKITEYDKREDVQNQDQPILLIHTFSRFLAWLQNEQVPFHLQRERSPEHIKDYERAFILCTQCLKENGEDMETFTIQEINDHTVGKIYATLENRGFSGRTINKYIGFMKTLCSWYNNEFNVQLKNYFKKGPKRNETPPERESISDNEFEDMLELVTLENGRIEYPNGIKPKRNLFRPWLKNAFKIGHETGGRREEIITLRWSDIKERNGIPYIKVEDFKSNRIKNRIKPEEKRYKILPITSSLKKLLDEFDYEKNKGKDEYILEPQLKTRRNRVMADSMSRAFSHYYSLLGTGKKLTLKSLRKSFITAIEMQMGSELARIITGHSSARMIPEHYRDDRMIATTLYNMDLYPKESKREEDLSKIRTEKDKIKEQKSREV